MSKQAETPTTLRRWAPLITIAGILLFLIIVFLIVSRYLIDHRDDDATRALSERAEEATPSTTVRFRDDAALDILGADGNPKATIRVEIAETEDSRTQGLMGRTRMDETQGMLFIFDNEEYRSFWMANTPLPLDIIFVNAKRAIVTIQRNTVPYSQESVPSTAPAQYVVEVNAGFSDRHGLLVGDTIEWRRSAQ